MEATEKTFRHSFGKLVLMFLGGLFFAFIVYSSGDMDYFMLGITGLVFLFAVYYAVSSVKISYDEIVTTRLLGSKSLKWSDIARVSMRGQSLRLHNRDEDVTLSIDSQLDGYPEILDIIFNKRPDLFDVGENNVMSRNIWGIIFALGFGLLMLAISGFVFLSGDATGTIFGFMFVLFGLFMIGGWLLGAQRLELENQSMTMVYLYKSVSYTISDINSITLEKRRTRNGYIYFVQANLKSGKKLRLPTFKQGNALMYQILKRWHSSGTSNRPVYPT